MRRLLVLLVLALSVARADAQTVNRDDVLYLLPQWIGLQNADDATVDRELADLRRRLGPEGPYVKLGFTNYIFISMTDWNVDISNPSAVQAALAGTISQIDNVVTKARVHGFPVALAMLTQARDTYDPAQQASENEDIRSMQWYADNVLAAGWWTPSRYARKQYAVQQAYIREIGKVIANRMSLYPDTVVAASGDGEVELAFARGTNIYADYSPFAVAEFRDWLRRDGLYADGAAFSGQSFAQSSRYAGDRTPGEDTNRDGHTLNGDFGTSFQTWNLLHFDWSLSDPYKANDPNAISSATYASSAFVRLPGQIANGFDPPRVPKAANTDAWWDLWILFKQTMLQRHNQEFAKWITTSPDPATGATVPPARWYSYQIPADYIFNGTPANPNERWYSSSSSWWTADISPYGSLGITSFNLDFRGPCGFVENDAAGCFVARTLSGVAPAIAGRNLRWGIIEWHPDQHPDEGGASSSLELSRAEMVLVKQYRPSLLVPFDWGDPNSPIQDTGFEIALRELVAALKDGTPADTRVTIERPTTASLTPPFALTGWAADLGKIRGPGRGTGVDRVEVYAYPNPGSGQAPIFLGAATYGGARTDVATTYGTQFTNSGYAMTVAGLAAGPYNLVVNARSTVTQTFNVSSTIAITVAYPATVSPAALRFGVTKSGIALVTTTPAQVVTPGYTGPGTPVWAASADQSWLQITNGPGTGQFTVGVVNPDDVISSRTSLPATLTVTASNLNLTATVPITLTVESAGASTLPFGSFDTPVDGASNLAGSIAVTGWALDDIGIDRVEIWRDRVAGETTPLYSGSGPGNGKIFIANALFINGARPDVEAAYPNKPQAYRAGWGYLLLTQGLWSQGNGTYTLYAFAYDKDGHSATLGSKTIAVDNAHGAKPFGAIDTPDLGATVSGGFWNFGWALTPNTTATSCVITNGNVFMAIDSGPLTPVSYGDLRSDIAAAFPGFTNGTGAGGAFYIDTTTLANGTHQIGWLVTDSCGRADGIGSRFFTVFNAGGITASTSPAHDSLASVSVVSGFSRTVDDPIGVRRAGTGLSWSYPNRDGIRVVAVDQNERVELQLPPADGVRYAGVELVNGARRGLPIGSSLDGSAGIFYWQPAPGFLGIHDLEFVPTGSVRLQADLVRVRIVVGPSMRMAVDTPVASSMLSGSFVVAGWALDLAAEEGTGVDAVHVWAYPVAGGAPIFAGAAVLGGTRPDVGALYGKQFENAAYDLTVTGLRPGAYNLVVYARRAATGVFDAAQAVRVTVP